MTAPVTGPKPTAGVARQPSLVCIVAPLSNSSLVLVSIASLATKVLWNLGVFATPAFFEPQMLGPKGESIMLALSLSRFSQAMDISMVRGRWLLETLGARTAKGPIVVWAPRMLAYAAATSIALVAGMVISRRASSRVGEMA